MAGNITQLGIPLPVPVTAGGTSNTSATAYAPICGGITTTGHFQSASTGISTAGFVLTSNGSSALPSFQAGGSSNISITGDTGGALTSNAFTFTGGTTGLTFNGAVTTETLGGVLVVSNGGTGASTLTGVLIGNGTSPVTGNPITQFNVLVGDASNAIDSIAPSATSGVPLISMGSAMNPRFGTAVVAGGGTGVVTFTAYAPIVAGTTATGSLQQATTGFSTAGFILTSTGSSSIPTFQAPAASSISITGDSGGALTGNAFTFTGGTTGLTFAGAGHTETLGGVLIVANGGTGASTLSGVLIGHGTSPVTGNPVNQYDVLVGGASNAIVSITPSATVGIPLISMGSAANPAFGTAVVAGGGTGVVTFTPYAPIIGGNTSTNPLQQATTGFSTSGFILTSTGASSAPTFQAPAASSISITGDTGGALTGNAFTFTGGTTGLTFNGAVSTETLGGVLVVTNGGTGAATLTGVLIGNGTSPVTGNPVTQHDVLVGGASNAITSVAPSATVGIPLVSGGSAADPSFGTAVVAGGGTGAVTLTLNGVVVGNGTSAVQITAAGTTGQVLTGVTGSAPTFQALPATSITITGDTGGALAGNAFTFTGGTTGLRFNGAGTTETLGGTLIVANGGTGATTLTGVLIGNATSPVTGNPVTQHDVLVGGASNAITSVAPSATSGVPLISNGSAADPSFGTAVVAGGGTGVTTLTAYAPIVGGTTSTGAVQQATTGFSNSGWVLTSTGASSLPTFQALTAAVITVTGDTGGALSGSAFTFTGGTTGLKFNGAGTTETLGGTLVVANGGTGATTLTGVLIGNGTSPVTGNPVTQYDVLVGGASNAIVSVAPSATAGIPLISEGSSTNPAFGTAVVAGGGTGVTTFTAYAPIVAGTTSTGAVQQATTGFSTSGFILTSTGASSVPTFQAPAASVITITGDSGGAQTGNAFTFTGGTTGLTFAGAANTETLGGVLVVSNGGTGASTLTGVLIGNGTSPLTGNPVTQYDVLVGGASNAITSVAPSATAGIPLVSNGSASNPSFGTAVVAGGGTGVTTLTAYAPILAGTTSTGAVQQATTGFSTVGYVLTSTGSSSVPTWQPTGSELLSYTPVSVGPYIVLATDHYLGVTTSTIGITIVFPNAPATGRAYAVKDVAGLAATYNITLTTVGGLVNFDGATTFVMNTAYESVQLIFNGTSYEIY